MQYIKSAFLFFIGDEPNLTFENKIFNITSFIGSLLLFFMSVSNAMIQMDILGIVIPLIASFFFLSLYYFSRFEQRFALASILCIPLMYGLSSIMWFVNGGESGSIIHSMQVYFLFFFAILPRKYHIPFSLFHILNLSALYILEYAHPEWVFPYKGRNEQMIDQVITLIFSIVCAYLIMMSIKSIYEEKNKEIEKQKEALQELNGLKDKMLSIISHDVRSPLGQLKSLLYLVTETDISQAQRDYLFKEVAKSVDETQNLLDTLVTWASLQLKDTKTLIKEEEIALKALVKQEGEVFSAQIKKKNLSLNCTIPSQLNIISDIHILGLVIRNLLSNAVKFSNFGGEILLGIEEKSDYIILYVRDNGVGISQERLNNLLHFGKNSSTIGTYKEKGSGLGLLLCKEFIEKSGGKLHIESELDKGTTFYVSIPRK